MSVPARVTLPERRDGVRRQQPGDGGGHRRLARAGLADERDHLARPRRQVDAAHRRDDVAAGRGR